LKFLFSYIIFFVFALRPAINIGCILYYELNIDYIVETYCVNTDKPELKCNGKCYLSKQLQLNSQNSTNSQQTDYTIVEAFYPVYYQDVSTPFIRSIVVTVHKNVFPFSIGKTSSYDSSIEEPPEVLC